MCMYDKCAYTAVRRPVSKSETDLILGRSCYRKMKVMSTNLHGPRHRKSVC